MLAARQISDLLRSTYRLLTVLLLIVLVAILLPVKFLSEITKTPILDEVGKLTAASPGVKAKYQDLELEPTAAKPGHRNWPRG